ncbi:MAG: tetratricopeptide repeat protein [Calditrichaeota bacterium]|nr:tetratricopeptide repeat protein [Calditrichota bacterium]
MKTAKKLWIIIPVITATAALVYFLWYPASKWIAANMIADLPDLQGKPDATVVFLNEMHKNALKNPLSGSTVGKLAMTYHANSFYDDAIKTYDRAIALNEEHWQWLYYKALIAEELGDIQSTITLLEQVIKLEPNVGNAWFRLGNALFKQNEMELANSSFRKILTIKPLNLQSVYDNELSNRGAFPLETYAKYMLARIAYQQQDFKNAVDYLNQIINEQPAFGSAYRLLGQIKDVQGNDALAKDLRIQAGDFENYIPPADPVFDELVFYSRQTGFILKQFDIALNSENFRWALFLVNHILKYNPDEGEALEKLLRLGIYLKQFESAEAVLDKFLEVFKLDEGKLKSMARYMIERGQYKYAYKLIDQAMKLNPAAIDAHISYLQILSSINLLDQAIDHCNEILVKYPDNNDLLVEYAKILRLKGMPGKANQQIEMVLKEDAYNADALYQKGLIEKNRRNQSAAISNFLKSLKSDPVNNLVQMELINYLLELHRDKDALDYLNEFLEVSPNSIDLVERKAWLLATSVRSDIRDGNEAMKLAKRLSVRQKNTYHQTIRSGMALAAAYAELNQYDQAISTATQFRELSKKVNLQYYLPQLDNMIMLFRKNSPYRS